MKEERKIVHKNFVKADYPTLFVNSGIIQHNNKFKEQQIVNSYDYIVPSYLFDDKKLFILLKLPFFEQNERKSKDFMKSFHKFTNEQFRYTIH